MNGERVAFRGSNGHLLRGRVGRPAGEPLGWALFAHCFTCGKDLRSARRITAALVEQGWGVLRFDFAGIGESEGDFEQKTFGGNVKDLEAAADWMAENVGAPSLLVGHSWGGTAVLVAASHLPSVTAVATLGAPSDPAHVTHLFADQLDTIESEGRARVELAGRPFTIGRDLVDEVREHRLEQILQSADHALLVLHSPTDAQVGIEHATRLFKFARHPKSFISLDGADHLLGDPADADWAGRVIASWAGRHLARHTERAPSDTDGQHGEVLASIGAEGFATEIVASGHRLHADEPESVGGENTGPTPYDLLLASLGACTAMTLRMYAGRKDWPLTGVKVALRHDSDHGGDASHADRKDFHIRREVRLQGPLDDDQRARLLQIADRCPVHRTLHGEVFVETHEVEA